MGGPLKRGSWLVYLFNLNYEVPWLLLPKTGVLDNPRVYVSGVCFCWEELNNDEAGWDKV